MRTTAYTTDRTGRGDLYVIDANGRNKLRLTRSSGIDLDPAWAPQTRRLDRVTLETDARLDKVDRYGRLLRYVHRGPLIVRARSTPSPEADTRRRPLEKLAVVTHTGVYLVGLHRSAVGFLKGSGRVDNICDLPSRHWPVTL